MVSKKWMKKMAAGGIGIALLLGMTACGASNNGSSGFAKNECMDMVVTENNTAWNGNYESGKDSFSPSTIVQSPSSASDDTIVSTTRKTIKTARLTLQTLEFDEFAVALEQKVAETGSYFQYADVSGSDYYGGSRRYASYTIRVPEARLNEFLEGLDGIATVTNKTLGEQDVTLSYVDTESRIKALEIEQESLMGLLEKAVNLDSIIMLQDRLSDVRYELENYKAQLRTYDDRISYSTVTISVSEVTKVSEPVPETVGERIASGWKNTMEDIAKGAQDALVWFVINLPYLVFWGAILCTLVIFFRKKRRERKQRRIEKQKENDAEKMGNQE